MKRKTQTDQARENVLGTIREWRENALRCTRNWDGSGYGSTYRRERARLWRVALEAVERAK